jgi:hypothetical protein
VGVHRRGRCRARAALRVVRSSIPFVFGLTAVFVLLGAGAGLVGATLTQNQFLLQQVAGFVLIVFGLVFMGLLPWPERLIGAGLVAGARRRGSRFLLGGAFAVCAAPCIGPVLATILANFLRENGIVPEKCDLNSILFLLTPAEDMGKLQQLVAQLVRFEKLLESDVPLKEVLPSLYKQHPERYADYTLRQICQEMHDLYARHNVKQLQKEMFRKSHFPRVMMNPQEANYAYLRGEVELVSLRDAEGRIAAEGALPYPPGVLCVVPGEVWGGSVLRYFAALEDGINLLPGFAPELQGVYVEECEGRKQVRCNVIKQPAAQPALLKGETL